jgi:hypothetical protein
MLLGLLVTTCVSAAPITNIRNSVSPARVRFVLDSEKPIAYKVEQAGKKLVIKLPESSANKKDMLVKDNIVRSAQMIHLGRTFRKLYN